MDYNDMLHRKLLCCLFVSGITKPLKVVISTFVHNSFSRFSHCPVLVTLLYKKSEGENPVHYIMTS